MNKTIQVSKPKHEEAKALIKQKQVKQSYTVKELLELLAAHKDKHQANHEEPNQ